MNSATNQPTVYCLNVRRNKLGEGKSITLLKKQLAEQTGHYCAMCSYCGFNLALDHILPLALGGSSTDSDNLQLLCKVCHRKKTEKDQAIIRAFKSLGIMERVSVDSYHFYIHPSKVSLLFAILSSKYGDAKKVKEIYNSDYATNKPYILHNFSGGDSL